MTSANPGGEPLVTGNDEALARLAGIADAFLVHDRDIVVGCDDSVVRALPGARHQGFQFVRRARGYTPQAIRLARAGPPVLAVGGYFKNTVCVTRGDEAFVSQHVGDLDNAATCTALERGGRAPARRSSRSRPRCVAHDLHPDFHSTRFAARYAQRARRAARWPCSTTTRTSPRSRPSTASRARCSAWRSTASASAPTARAWGGELLLVDGAPQRPRRPPVAPLRLPGGDRAAREPWRMAAAALPARAAASEIAARFADEPRRRPVATMLARGPARPADDEHGPLVRRRRRAARRVAPHGVRGPGGDAARGPRATPRPGARRQRALYAIDGGTSST